MAARLAEHLVSRGILPASAAEEAQRRRASLGGGLDTALLELEALPEHVLLIAASELCGMRPVNLADFEPNPEMSRFVPANVAERLAAVPLSEDAGVLHIACAYPPPVRDLEEVSILLGKKLELWVALEPRVRDWIAAIYRAPLAPRFASLLIRLDPSRAPPEPIPLREPKRVASAIETRDEDDDGLVEEWTLEEVLGREMAERIARAAGAVQPGAAPEPEPQSEPDSEPIPLEYRKPKPATAQRDETVRVDMRALAARTAEPEPTVSVDLRELAKSGEPEPTVTFDLRTLAKSGEPEPTVTFDLRTLAKSGEPEPTVTFDLRSLAKSGEPEPTVTFDLRSIAQTTADAPAPPVPFTMAPPPSAGTGGWSVTPSPAPAPLDARLAETEEVEDLPPVVVFSSHASESAEPPPPQQTVPGAAVRNVAGASVTALAPLQAYAAEDDEPDWTLDDARDALSHATDRDQLIWIALRMARRAFEFAAAFAVVRGTAAGWVAEGPGAEAFHAEPPAIPLDAPSIFRTVAVTRSSYLGPPPPDANTAAYLAQFGRAPRTAFLFPVEVNGRLVCFVYGDPGLRAVSQRRLADLVLLCQELSGAFGRLILDRKQRHPAHAPQAPAPQPPSHALQALHAPQPPSAPAEQEVGLGWSPAAPTGTAPYGRAATRRPPVVDEVVRPPADFGSLLRRLIGPDATARAAAIAQLSLTPEHSARALVSRFPGPTAWSRLPVHELPEPEELGPVPSAIAMLGRPGAVALAPLLDAEDTDTRYFALLTAGSLPFPELVGGVLRGLFDLDPDIASAARAAAGALRRLPRFAMSMRDLRQELASQDALRRSLAARALGVLHDRDAVDALINLTGSDDLLCAEAAAVALGEITRQTFGSDPHAWTRWWAENRVCTRAEWLVGALRHHDLHVRMAAIEELSRPVNDAFGYVAEAPEHLREAAIHRWEEAVAQDPRLRRLE